MKVGQISTVALSAGFLHTTILSSPWMFLANFGFRVYVFIITISTIRVDETKILTVKLMKDDAFFVVICTCIYHYLFIPIDY